MIANNTDDRAMYRIPGRLTRYDGVRVVLGVILLVAALLKAHQLITDRVPEAGILDSRGVRLATVEFELAFALWLLSGLYRRLSWMAGVICFAGFASITFYKAVSGQASCGCFGNVEVNPWHTLMLDIAAVTALAFSRPQSERRCRKTRLYLVAFYGVMAVVLLASFVVLLGASRRVAVRTDDLGIVTDDGKLVVLEPERWPSKRFALLEHIDIGKQIGSGRWTVVLYRFDCSHCMEIVPKYERWAKEHAAEPGIARVALIEIPPYGGPAVILRPEEEMVSSPLHGRLDETKEWFANTPVVAELHNGIVIKIDNATDVP